MKNSLVGNLNGNSLVIFWLGMLTGALIVGLIFFYRFISPGQYESAVLRTNLAPRATQQFAPQQVKAYGSSTKSLPGPVGNYTALPGPVGN
ncbi:hypothetical protein HZA40_03420 [Candidatus Peregrinibacteria bacterium]|nr:hypothetical protein [Candidatus Peregrinibacteria bacterium]